MAESRDVTEQSEYKEPSSRTEDRPAQLRRRKTTLTGSKHQTQCAEDWTRCRAPAWRGETRTLLTPSAAGTRRRSDALTFSLQGEGAESSVWKFATKVGPQPQQPGQEEREAQVRTPPLWMRLFQGFRTFADHLPSPDRLNREEPFTWKESFSKLLSSQSKSSPTSLCVLTSPDEDLT